MPSALARAALRLLFPPCCAFCGEPVAGEGADCPRCRADLPFIPAPRCRRCGQNLSDCACGRRAGGPIRQVVAPFYYEDPVAGAVMRLKRRGGRQVVAALAAAMAGALRESIPDGNFAGIVPVPMTGRQRRERGFNQSDLLADELSRLTGVPVAPLLFKACETAPQHTLAAALRAGNVAGVYRAARELSGGDYLLLDDVVTTGATSRECAEVLRLAGAGSVTVVTAAVTRLKKPQPVVK